MKRRADTEATTFYDAGGSMLKYRKEDVDWAAIHAMRPHNTPSAIHSNAPLTTPTRAPRPPQNCVHCGVSEANSPMSYMSTKRLQNCYFCDKLACIECCMICNKCGELYCRRGLCLTCHP
ncbi:hypothetical protein BCR33DRAFT_713210 [Rhizoclosmatium globosum]|uniref:Uncharacterized protein n=1 Tax=Rhizoclosmatium globosum TaxID=329046 RepID=A0A1Y2CTP2_9FUNG|nr:hypothetical protein BCR33DRAFT_713210 [Rhizoclosmatium globosum]|eukprot:ORY50391.1 hypothetical protein BCR33DRAFT_713210 [Rhizoclosmatium globosum]